MKRALAAVIVVGTLSMAGSAAATKPSRGCPDGFDLGDRDEVAAIIKAADPSATDDRITAFFNSYDKNADGLVCHKPHPHVINPIDNTANR